MNYLDYFDEGGKSRTMEYYILPNKQQQQRNVDRNSIALDVIYRLLSKLKQKSNDKETNAQSTQNTSNNNSYSRNSQLANTPFGPAFSSIDTFRIGDRDIFIYHQ